MDLFDLAKTWLQKWLRAICSAIESGKLQPGDASKLVGRLAFGAQFAFKRLGRAMLRPLYAQQYAPLKGGRVGPFLLMALRWWKQVLEL